MIKVSIIIMLAGAGTLFVLAALVWHYQHHLIYHPTLYRPTYRASLPPGAVELLFSTGEGRQTAFYIPPRNSVKPSGEPERLWVLFGGNGSVALNWVGWVREPGDPDAGFLLIDYPGYGCCMGNPSPRAMLANARGAFCALAGRLGVDEAALGKKTSLLGHSLGAAAALDFAVGQPVRSVVLLAPFTSMGAMARRVVGNPMALLLRHEFDNRARLAELAALPRPPKVRIVHGTSDQVVPVDMGRSLAAAFPALVEYSEAAGADHISVLDELDELLKSD